MVFNDSSSPAITVTAKVPFPKTPSDDRQYAHYAVFGFSCSAYFL